MVGENFRRRKSCVSETEKRQNRHCQHEQGDVKWLCQIGINLTLITHNRVQMMIFFSVCVHDAITQSIAKHRTSIFYSFLNFSKWKKGRSEKLKSNLAHLCVYVESIHPEFIIIYSMFTRNVFLYHVATIRNALPKQFYRFLKLRWARAGSGLLFWQQFPFFKYSWLAQQMRYFFDGIFLLVLWCLPFFVSIRLTF